ncbi:SEC-C domain-containing protein [Actinoplanes sp. DH11]|uniref:SEC-C domain-containing protein n=1 Tax=Actinoplanes sp. DH11 TaxID=2857011 RepID=UPI001E45CC3B|nr:SEC-C domain-containing protein [Actinoplanes sp. DH11]
MSSFQLLTSDDLDEIGHGALRGGDLRAAATELVAAVDGQALADPADAGYALMLAAELTEKQGDLPPALALVERAIEAYRQVEAAADGFARARRGELLSRLGREDEAMSVFTALRPRLIREPVAAAYLAEALEECGEAAIAEQWLTAALTTVLDRPDGPERARLTNALLQVRRRVRRDLELPADEYDDAADRMRSGSGAAPAGSGVMFWPRGEFDKVLLRWPAFADVYGHTWDDHRADLERALTVWTESGQSGFRLHAGSVDDLAEHVARHGGDPADAGVRAGYARHLESHEPGTAWPPGRNDPCWCGSAAKYKKCCLPRSR